MNNSSHWLFRWLDDQNIRDLRDAESVLSYPIVVDDLRQQANIATSEKSKAPIINGDGISILAGRGLDLSGYLDCNASSCRKRQVDDLFSHVWHYFDRIVVTDAVTHFISKHWKDGGEEEIKRRNKWLLSHIEVLLYLRQIGAEALVEFREKPNPCQTHWRQHAKAVGLQHVLDSEKNFLKILLQEARISIEAKPDGSVHFAFVHPEFEHTVWGDLSIPEIRGKKQEEIHRAVASAVMRRYVAHLTSDVAAAQHSHAPLGSTLAFHAKLLQLSHEVKHTDVAFRIKLPVLQGISTDTLIKIRRDEHEHFQRFQDRLRVALKEGIKAAPSADASKLAEEIRIDLIEPELRRIRERLVASKRLLKKKTAIGVFLSTLATTCGVLCGVSLPVTVSGGIAPFIAAVGQAASKHLEEKREIELEDMYFLWKAVEHRPHTD